MFCLPKCQHIFGFYDKAQFTLHFSQGHTQMLSNIQVTVVSEFIGMREYRLDFSRGIPQDSSLKPPQTAPRRREFSRMLYR